MGRGSNPRSINPREQQVNPGFIHSGSSAEPAEGFSFPQDFSCWASAKSGNFSVFVFIIQKRRNSSLLKRNSYGIPEQNSRSSKFSVSILAANPSRSRGPTALPTSQVEEKPYSHLSAIPGR